MVRVNLFWQISPKWVQLKLCPYWRQLPIRALQSRSFSEIKESGHLNPGPLLALGKSRICRIGRSLPTTACSRPCHLRCSPRQLCTWFHIERQRQPVSGPFRFGPISGARIDAACPDRYRPDQRPPIRQVHPPEADLVSCPPLEADADSLPYPLLRRRNRPRARHYPHHRSSHLQLQSSLCRLLFSFDFTSLLF